MVIIMTVMIDHTVHHHEISKDLFVFGKLGEGLRSVEFQMFVGVRQDPHLGFLHAYHDHNDDYIDDHDQDIGVLDYHRTVMKKIIKIIRLRKLILMPDQKLKMMIW